MKKKQQKLSKKTQKTTTTRQKLHPFQTTTKHQELTACETVKHGTHIFESEFIYFQFKNCFWFGVKSEINNKKYRLTRYIYNNYTK